jgi:hypothetical protein
MDFALADAQHDFIAAIGDFSRRSAARWSGALS